MNLRPLLILLLAGAVSGELQPLRVTAAAKGKFVGAAISNPQLMSPEGFEAVLRERLGEEFNAYVAENAFTMASLLPKPPTTPFSPPPVRSPALSAASRRKQSPSSNS